ncbi:SRPBCC family protein [Amycolatopsis anabasis]|uniref:SRPBCC family protein n=1 Tax=Amycolatopsis anabasis TaxID=1840409 RepID=UPI00131D48B7|nr:SRPBCC family protein [Amycolatopsis anabasis]
MRLDHEFTVPASVEEVWQAVIDPERVAPCMPGATLKGVDGAAFQGTVKVKLGPISLLYKGSGEFLERDEAARKVVIKASGKDARGAGTASATVTVTLAAEGDRTRGTVATDLQVTGKPAQFGRGLISEVGGKILDSFAACLAEKLGTTAEPEPEKPGATAAEPEPEKPGTAAEPEPEKPAESASPKLTTVENNRETEAIDLVDLAGAPVAKRLAPLIAGAAALLVLLAVLRRLRRR